MKRATTILAALAVAFAVSAAPVLTATETFVTNKIAEAIENLPKGGISTNDVCNIVTNVTTEGFTEWSYTYLKDGMPDAVATNIPAPYFDGEKWFPAVDMRREGWDIVADTDNMRPDALMLLIELFVEPYQVITATRTRLTRNALGLAGLDDLPPLTNGLPDSISAVAQAATNYTDAAISAFTPAPVGRSWNRPNEWTLAYEPVLETKSTTFDNFTTNDCGMVFSNSFSRTVRGLSARVFTDALDPFADATPPPVELSVPEGIVEGGVVSVPSNGIYRVRGTTADGEAREITVPFASGIVNDVVVTTYMADREGPRKLANDFSASVLSAMTDAGTTTYINETETFRIWRTIQPTFSWPGVGNTTPFAVSPRVMATAAHYADGMIWGGSITLTNWVDGGTFTVSRGSSVKLAEWAATNGFTAAEIAAAGDLSDIRMIPITAGEIPANCCPWFASVEWIAENYGDLRGLCAWCITQGNRWHPAGNALQWAIPVVLRGGSLTAANTWMSAGGLKSGDVMPREDIATGIGVYNVKKWYEIRGGDSGKPVWICDFTAGSRRDILVSHFHTVGSGPNYAAALPLIRAYCAAHGTTLKEMQ